MAPLLVQRYARRVNVIVVLVVFVGVPLAVVWMLVEKAEPRRRR